MPAVLVVVAVVPRLPASIAVAASISFVVVVTAAPSSSCSSSSSALLATAVETPAPRPPVGALVAVVATGRRGAFARSAAFRIAGGTVCICGRQRRRRGQGGLAVAVKRGHRKREGEMLCFARVWGGGGWRVRQEEESGRERWRRKKRARGAPLLFRRRER